MVISMIDVSEGRTKYWLVFRAYVGEMSRHNKYTIEFCGTEVRDGLSFNDERHEKFRRMLIEDYGFGPYNIEDAKEILKTHSSYNV